MKIIKFNAIWCSGCIVMKKAIKEIEKQHPDIEIESYDYDMDTDKVEEWHVGDILPVLIFLDENNQEISRLNGEKTLKEIEKEIAKIS